MANKKPDIGKEEITSNKTIIEKDDAIKNDEIKDNGEVKEEKTTKQAVKYFLCMCSAGVIEFLTYLLFIKFLPIDHTRTIHFINEVQLYIFVSELISLALSIIWNFTFNRKFTFKSSNNVPVSMALAFLFYVPFYPFALWFVPFATPYIGIFAKIIKMVINGVLEFMWQKFIMYGKFGNWVQKKIGNKKVNK